MLKIQVFVTYLWLKKYAVKCGGGILLMAKCSKIEGKEIKSDADQINFLCFSLIQVLLQSHFKILVCLYIYCLINFALINLI